MVDLNELKLRLIDRLAGSIAVGEIGDDGAFVGRGPWGPLEGDFIAGGDRDVGLAGSGIKMADDLRGRVVVRVDVAIAHVLRVGPAGDGGWRALVLGRRIVAGICGTADTNVLDVAVGGGGAGE